MLLNFCIIPIPEWRLRVNTEQVSTRLCEICLSVAFKEKSLKEERNSEEENKDPTASRVLIKTLI